VTRTADVRVGIVSYGTPAELATCLEALPLALEGVTAEVVVVDNGSPTPADAEVARRFPVRLLRLARNVGYPRGMNLALSSTSAPVLLALNPDTLPSPGALSHLVAALQRQPDVGLISPSLKESDGSLQHSAYAFPSARLALVTGLVPHRLRGRGLGERLLLEGHARLDSPHDVDWTVGAVHCIRRSAVGRDRVYSERAFMYAEDLEICWHVKRQGWRVVYDPTVEVVHVGNVAGARDFGATREQRWLDATYDWCSEERGTGSARLWAAANVVGLSAKRAVLSRSSDAAHRAFVQELLSFHAKRVVSPAGDRHSRLAPDGRAPEEPNVVEDSGPASAVGA
jgi:N-acetylglucosaminyl-diphospho-decaprenol L-rhamnosyltransferase